jgi:hypothetical protein
MSLKWFHVVFVTVCSLLCAVMVLWGFMHDMPWLAVVSAVLGVALTLYGNWFLQKAKKAGL